MREKGKRKAAAVAALLMLSAPAAYADGFSVYEWSARGVGMGGAMMFSDEASLIGYNPAAITQFDEKSNVSGAITYIGPRGYADFIDGNENVVMSQHNRNNPACVPALFYARQIQPNAWFGVGLYPRFGLKSSYDPGWYGRYSNRSTEFCGVSVAPTAAWKINPSLSMSLGFELMYANLYMDKSVDMRNMSPALRDVYMDLDGSSWGMGWNAGLNWNVNDRLSLAFLYRSEVKQTIEGDVNFFAGDMHVATRGSGVIHLPESWTFGVGYRFDDRTRVEFDAIRTNWSSYDKLSIDFAVPLRFRPIFSGKDTYTRAEAKNWRDGWRYQFGVEHRLDDRWTLRAGFVYDQCSSNNADTADFMVPTGTRRTYTLGASCRVKNVEYTLGYGYMLISDKRINKAGEKQEDSWSRSCYANIVSLGARIDL
ncbi:MAG: OmpP1/FadL family transporter [Pyramidobacter sp.]|jgi:long-chain fatty acid transport protein